MAEQQVQENAALVLVGPRDSIIAFRVLLEEHCDSDADPNEDWSQTVDLLVKSKPDRAFRTGSHGDILPVTVYGINDHD